ncbi:MAG: hypothetical protein ABI395_00560 [Sphingobium sp.]
MKLKSASLALAVLLASGCQPKPVAQPADAKALMKNHVQPTAEVFWNSVQYISDESGSRKIEPKTDADWNRTLAAATSLRELGETLKGPEYASSRGADWKDYAQGLADISKQAEQAARQRSPDKVFEVGSSIYNVCSACHEVYQPTPGGLTPDELAPEPMNSTPTKSS